ncbi:hypothetical protein Lche_2712 [Legionella cherrii]|uniref:Uncharacterized protein n=1 Tax=Legionella cherrii TaxID=28084 RepID=A0A0W0SCE0_9GAMM|nr:hypothetical protein Lche_2712 [Legionella cherrii]
MPYLARGIPFCLYHTLSWEGLLKILTVNLSEIYSYLPSIYSPYTVITSAAIK